MICRNGWILFLVAIFTTCTGSSDPANDGGLFALAIWPEAEAINQATASHLDVPREGRFVAGGESFVVLDRRAPYLRLFRSGDLIWSGLGLSNGDSLRAEAVGVDGINVLLLSRGELSSWVHEGDSLRRTAAVNLPYHYLPLGAVRACRSGWRLYLIDENEVAGTGAPEPRRVPDDLAAAAAGVGVDDILIYPASAGAIRGGSGHAGTTIDHYSESTVVLHRPSQTQAGFAIEHGCDGNPVRRHSELAMATGDGIPVLVPRNRSLEWMAGIVATPSGFLIAMQRWFTPGVHDVDAFQYLTEVLRFENGQYAGSTILRGQWTLMDQGSQRVLLAASEPEPMVLVVPKAIFDQRIIPR